MTQGTVRRLVLYAPNVGSGGGLVLLRELVRFHWPDVAAAAILDRRGQARLEGLDPAIEVHWVEPSVAGRWRAERLLLRIADAETLILCFHNLPPVLPTTARVTCYVQNANLVGLIPASHLRGWPRVRIALERLIARAFRHRVSRYAVQTPTMAAALRDWYGPGIPPVDVLPFAPQAALAEAVPAAIPPRWDFVYVSDGSAHKNHRRLFAAWRLLGEEGVRPSLAVTLHPERDRVLRRHVEELAARGLRIEDLGQVSHADVLDAYRRARGLIFPSYAESFGLPLIEAQAAGLPILAPELDYVRDVCEPAVTFDAASPRSIARAVRRFLGERSDVLVPMTPRAFATILLRPDAPDGA